MDRVVMRRQGKFLAKGFAVAGCYVTLTLMTSLVAKSAGLDPESAALVGGVSSFSVQ